MKKWIGAALTAGIILQTSVGITNVNAMGNDATQTQTQTQNQNQVPEIKGDSGIAIDAYTGKVLYAKNEDKKEYPASITKMLTVILVKEHLKDNDIITFSKNAANQSPSNTQILYKEGEQMTVKDALHSLLIISSNDVAFALAEKVAGSVPEFAKMMNEKAKELGATNTHFETPNGLPNPNHYTTAHDMAIFGQEVFKKYPDIVKIMGERSAVIHTNQRTVKISSPNKIPKKNPNAIGGKTGYTDVAQHTLIEILKDGDKRVIAVTMHSTKDGAYDDMNIMSKYAFSQIKTKKLYSKGDVFHTFEMNGKEYPLILKENAVISMENNDTHLKQDIEWNKNKKTFKKGDTVGWIVIKNGDKEIAKFAVETNKNFQPSVIDKNKKYTSEDLNSSFPANSNSSYVWTFVLIFAVPIFTFLFLNVITKQKRRKRLNQ